MPEAPVAPPPPKAPDVPSPAPTPPLPGVASMPAEVSALAPTKGIDTSWIKGFFGKKEPVTEAIASSTAVVPAVASETRKAPEVVDLEPKVYSSDEKLPKYPKEGGDAAILNGGRFNRNGEHIDQESMTYYLHLGKNVEGDVIGRTAFGITRPEEHYIAAEPHSWEVNPNGDKGLVVLEQRGNQLYVRTGDGKQHVYDGEFFKDNMLTVDMDNAVALGIEGFDPDTRAIQISKRNRNEFTPPIPIPDRPKVLEPTTWAKIARDSLAKLRWFYPGLLVGQPIPPVDITPPPAFYDPAPVNRGTPVAMPGDKGSAPPIELVVPDSPDTGSRTPGTISSTPLDPNRPQATGEISDNPLFEKPPENKAAPTGDYLEYNWAEGDARAYDGFIKAHIALVKYAENNKLDELGLSAQEIEGYVSGKMPAYLDYSKPGVLDRVNKAAAPYFEKTPDGKPASDLARNLEGFSLAYRTWIVRANGSDIFNPNDPNEFTRGAVRMPRHPQERGMMEEWGLMSPDNNGI